MNQNKKCTSDHKIGLQVFIFRRTKHFFFFILLVDSVVTLGNPSFVFILFCILLRSKLQPKLKKIK